jgi:hypothetical protein
MIHKAIAPKNAKRDWVLDADLKAAQTVRANQPKTRSNFPAPTATTSWRFWACQSAIRYHFPAAKA